MASNLGWICERRRLKIEAQSIFLRVSSVRYLHPQDYDYFSRLDVELITVS
jgi:hypothetical protein